MPEPASYIDFNPFQMFSSSEDIKQNLIPALVFAYTYRERYNIYLIRNCKILIGNENVFDTEIQVSLFFSKQTDSLCKVAL